MSSSNLVEVTYVKEPSYGETPTPGAAVTLKTARFNTEDLSGTPTTTESEELRTDRMSGGQVVTGLEVGGPINFELSPDEFYDDFFEMGMMTDWVAATAAVAGSFTLDGVDPQKGVISGLGVTAGIVAGDVVVLVDTGTKHVFQAITITDSDNMAVACKKNQANVSGDVTRPTYLDIGTQTDSATVGKAYKDVVTTPGTNEKSQTYGGSLVSQFSLSANYGQIVTGSFTLSGNSYVQEASGSYAQQVIAAGGSVTPAGTSQKLNASIDVPVVTTEGLATEFCIETFNINFDNGLVPQNCIGTPAPRRYELGTANITVDASIYLGEQSYDAFMPAKLSQNPISMLFTMLNDDGGYAFALAAVQLSFPDPGASGRNQPVMIEASGLAKVGDNGESALRIYKL